MFNTRYPIVLACTALALTVSCSDSPDAASPDGSLDPDGGGSAASGGAGASGTGGTSGGSGAGTGGDGDGDGDTGGSGGDGDGGLLGDGGPFVIPDELKLCNGEACECADGIDNDDDGEIDGFDTECTGPGDNDEGTFATGIPGDNRDPMWQDCFFDGNSGAGDDGCRYHTECLTGEREPDHSSCELSQRCIDFCAPLTPNGCDCFGCCEITLDDGDTVNVVIGGGCSEETIDECTECVQTTTDCSNECGRCELCLGKTVDDLPDDCFPDDPPPTGGSGGSGGTGGSGGSGGTGGSDTPPYQCDGGKTPCSTQGDCSVGFYCAQGCCTLIPPE